MYESLCIHLLVQDVLESKCAGDKAKLSSDVTRMMCEVHEWGTCESRQIMPIDLSKNYYPLDYMYYVQRLSVSS